MNDEEVREATPAPEDKLKELIAKDWGYQELTLNDIKNSVKKSIVKMMYRSEATA